MLRLRSILSLILVVVTTLLVSCGGGVAKAPPTYTPEKIAQIQQALIPIQKVQARMDELGELVDAQDWVYVDNLIHGPFGNLRASMSYASRQLLPEDEQEAKEIAKEISDDFDKLAAAAKEQNNSLGQRSYGDVLNDLDAFLNMMPTESDS